MLHLILDMARFLLAQIFERLKECIKQEEIRKNNMGIQFDQLV